MRSQRTLALAAIATAAAAFAVPGALGGGGAPGVLQGSKGVTAPGGTVRYVAFSKGGGTVVAAVLVRGGQVARFRWLRGGHGIPLVTLDGQAGGLTRDGRTLVLAPVAPGITPTSRFALLDTRTLRVRQLVVLRGAFSYDALSPDGRTLYLIETLRQGGTYAVRAYDLRARKLLPHPIVEKGEADEPMVGSPVTRATSADGAWVYTLYRPGHEQPPFVHALDAKRRRAVCVDLPRLGAQRMTLRLSRDGKTLSVRGAGGVAMVLIDTTTFRTRRV